MFSKERFDMFRRSASAPKQAAPAEKPKKKAAPKKKKKKSAVEVMLYGDFTKKLAKHRDVREAFDGVIHLELSGPGGGAWTADLTKSAEWITPGLEGKPKLKLRAAAKDFTAVVRGKKKAQVAIMNGDLALEPMDLDLAMKLGPLFS